MSEIDSNDLLLKHVDDCAHLNQQILSTLSKVETKVQTIENNHKDLRIKVNDIGTTVHTISDKTNEAERDLHHRLENLEATQSERSDMIRKARDRIIFVVVGLAVSGVLGLVYNHLVI